MRGALSVLLPIACACALPACHDDDAPGLEAQQTKVAALCGAADSSQVPQAVFVSTTGSDDGGCGTSTSRACKSLQQGIAHCATPGCAVFVRHGLYATRATVRLRDGVSVHGSCRFDGEADRQYRTVIDAAPAPGTPAVAADGVNSPTVFDGIVIIGKDESTGGTASIAMAVSHSKGLTLTRSVLVAGRGGDGAPVDPPPAGSAQGGGGGDTSSYSPGGQGPGGPSCDAGGTAGRGGAGSARRQNTVSGCISISFSCDCNEAGGLKGSDGTDSGWVSAGSGGGSGTQGHACWEGVIRQGTGGQGSTGGAGSAGACSSLGGGTSTDVWGSFQGASWLPGSGGAGGSGDVGSGGGGGGPGGLCTLRTADTGEWFPYWGQPGGGGGAGGCGGPGGPGGQQGGASIGLLLAASSMPLDPASLAIVGGPGGRGGQGATGGVGGAGGAGGAGGDAGSNCSLYDAIVNIGWGGPGGPGGPGGSGGAGGGGAGGNGGPSVGIVLTGASAEPDAGGVYAGFAGAGGGGGSGGAGGADGCSGATGQGGTAGGVAALRKY